MNWKRAVLVAVAVLVLLVAGIAGALSLYQDQLYRDSYESTYSYRVSFGANESLENVTVYAPIPVEDGEVRVVGTNVTTRSYDETAPPDAPPVSASVVETDRGPMLALTVDRYPVETKYYRFVEEDGVGRRVEINESEYDPGDPEMVAYTDRSVQVEVSVQADHSIDTRSPTGTEPLLSPEYTREPTDCRDDFFESARCYAVTSDAYLDYDGPAGTQTTLWVELAGRNEWWVFGWSGNSYEEDYIVEFTGPQDGWVRIEGTLMTGWGNYRGGPPDEARSD
jgi:hypothetical protein